MVILFIVLLTSIPLVFLLSGLYAYMQAFYAGGGKKNVNKYFENNESYQRAKPDIDRLIKEIEVQPFEEVYIKAYDGVKLFGRYYHTKDGAPLQIQIHGYKGYALRDFCGGHKLARKLGHNILLIDQRGTGKSKGRSITFGVKERKDALSWIRYATNRFGNIPIFLVGVSMGGATTLMVTDMDIPKNVVGAIADCPYSSPKEIIQKVCRDRGMPDFIYPIVTVGGLIYGHFNPDIVGAVKSVENSKVPILILHGRRDGFVPFEMAERIYNSANCKKYLYAFDDADHGMSYMTDPEKYEKATIDFINECLNDYNNSK